MFYSQKQFTEMVAKMAAFYGVADATEMFTIDVPKALQLIDAIQESDAFLARTSVIPTTDIAGRVVTLGITGTIAGTTDTTGAGERTPAFLTAKTERNYLCKQVNFDYGIRYEELDQWRRFPDYAARVGQMVLRRIALDLLLIGWYGESHAATSDRANNPLLQDVHPGWLHDLKTNKSANYIQPASGNDHITIGGAGSDYTNLDSACYDLLNLIPVERRNGRETVIIGRRLLAHEAEVLYDLYGRKPTEKQAMAVLAKGFAGMQSVCPAGFPDYGLMVIDPANLQRYVQDGSIRKQIKDNARKDQIEHYQSENLDYRIGDLDAAAALDYTKVQLGSDEPAAQKVIVANTAANPLPVNVTSGGVVINNTAENPVLTRETASGTVQG